MTSDHREAFGERSRARPELRLAGHNGGIHEPLLYVPILVRYSNGRETAMVEVPTTLMTLLTAVRNCLAGAFVTGDFAPEAPVTAAVANKPL